MDTNKAWERIVPLDKIENIYDVKLGNDYKVIVLLPRTYEYPGYNNYQLSLGSVTKGGVGGRNNRLLIKESH